MPAGLKWTSNGHFIRRLRADFVQYDGGYNFPRQHVFDALRGPGLRDLVARELRGRVKRAFSSAGIAMMNILYGAPPLPANEFATGEGPQQKQVQQAARMPNN